MKKYPTKNANGLDIPRSINILITCQLLTIFLIHLLLINTDYSLHFDINIIIFILIVFVFSSYYRTIAIKTVREVVIYNTSEFIVLSSIVLFESITLTLITITLYIFSHFLFGLRNSHQLIFNFANGLLSGSFAFYCYIYFVRDFIIVSNSNLIVGSYILTVIYYLLNNIQTIMVVSLFSDTDVLDILVNKYDKREEFYIIVVSATAIIFTIIVPNLYPVFYILIFILLIQQISKQQEVQKKNQAKLELKQLHHENEIQELKMRELKKLKIFSGKVAHDIRNYITILSVNLQLIEDDLHEKQRTRLNSVIDNIEEIVNYLYDFSAQEKLQLDYVDITSFVEEIVELNLFGSGYDYQLKVIDRRILVEIDTIKMKQVLSNILINAKEALHGDGGMIQVSIDLDNDQKNMVVIRIEDNGRGIAEEHKHRIFDPFFSTKERGSGLGITLANSIILAHRGKLAFESHDQKGTEFIISLPVKDSIRDSSRSR